MSSSLNKTHNHLLLSLRQNRRTINLNDIQYLGTKYPIIRDVAINIMQYQVVQDSYSLLWTDYPLTVQQIKSEDATTRINHLPEITQITRKNKMASNLNIMRSYFPKDYDFYPETWVLPRDHHKLMKRHTKGKVYIVKPQNGCQGQGIYLLSNPIQLQKQAGAVVQEYVMTPMLINGLKFDLRIYVLLTGVSPFRVYLFKQGLARLATEEFQNPKEDNLNNYFSHLTNYAINKLNGKFRTEDDSPGNGHKRLLTSVFQNEDYDNLMEKVADIVIKTLISGLPQMQNAFSQCKRSDPSSCFQLLGFDIMLTDKKEPILLEVNQNPSLVTDSLLDYNLKSKLVRDIIQITSVPQSFPDQKMEVKLKQKDRYEIGNLGDFNRIYPCKNLEKTEFYDQFMAKACSIYRQKYGMNIVRNVRHGRQGWQGREVRQTRNQEMIAWNLQPLHYNRERVQRVYGNRSVKTSQIKKRLLYV